MPDHYPTMLGRWLRECRGDRSQSDVSARIQMDQAEWSKWETGRRKEAKPDQLKGFAHAVSASVTSMALAYAGIWPPDVVADAGDAQIELVRERYTVLELPPDVRYDELLMLKHLFRGMRGYEDEARAQQSDRAGRLVIPGAEPSGRERAG